MCIRDSAMLAVKAKAAVQIISFALKVISAFPFSITLVCRFTAVRPDRVSFGAADGDASCYEAEIFGGKLIQSLISASSPGV